MKRFDLIWLIVLIMQLVLYLLCFQNFRALTIAPYGTLNALSIDFAGLAMWGMFYYMRKEKSILPRLGIQVVAVLVVMAVLNANVCSGL